jgi:NitT/TauT family transport system substrate-binding protein
MTRIIQRSLFLFVVIVTALLFVSCSRSRPERTALRKIRMSVAPFQDTLLPLVGAQKGWYREEGLDVEIKLLPWYNVQEALAGGSIDVGMGNIASVIGAHYNFPNNVYFYGFDIFDNGFAIMVRPKSGIKTVAELEKSLGDHTKAVTAAVRQLQGKTVVTTSRTDMEQVVAYAVRSAGMELGKNVRVIDMEPDEGLAAFLGGTGDAYVGGIPQRTRAAKEGYIELVSGPDLGPAEINGFVTTKKFASEHEEDLLKLLKVMFRTIDYTNSYIDDTATIIVAELNRNTAANFTTNDFKRFWNNYEHYMANPAEAQQQILTSTSATYWKRRWDDCNFYFVNVSRSIPATVDPAGVFLMDNTQQAYIQRFGR